MGQSSWFHIEGVTVLRTTDKAVQVDVDGEEIWFPRSQISGEGEKLKEGDKDITLSVTEWIAKQKGFEVDA